MISHFGTKRAGMLLGKRELRPGYVLPYLGPFRFLFLRFLHVFTFQFLQYSSLRSYGPALWDAEDVYGNLQLYNSGKICDHFTA
jgi:hypothetical protein